MKTYFLLFLFAIFGVTIAQESLKAKNNNKCVASPLTIILEKYHKGHPYENVNIKRDKSYWNVYNQRIKLGRSSDYKMGEAAGKGKFARVYKATHLATQEPVAIKIILHGMEDKILKEIKILEELRNAPNFIPIRDVLREIDKGKVRMALIFDLLETRYYRDFYPGLTRYQVKSCIYEILKTLDYAHSKGIMHRDIKPLNILMDQNKLNYKVIDWGHSDFYLPGNELSVRVASLHYKGPELILNYTMHDYSLDIWSTGALMAAMAFKKIHFFQANPEPNPNDPSLPPLEAKLKSFRAHLDAIAQVLGTTKLKQYVNKFKDYMDASVLQDVGNYKRVPLTDFINENNTHMIEPGLIDLLNKMLVYDHTRRITAQEAINHYYFNEIRYNIERGQHFPLEKPVHEVADELEYL